MAVSSGDEAVSARRAKSASLVCAVLKQLVPRQKTLAGQLVACVTVSFGTVQLYWSWYASQTPVTGLVREQVDDTGVQPAAIRGVHWSAV